MPIRIQIKVTKTIKHVYNTFYECIVYADKKMDILQSPPQNSCSFPRQGVLHSSSGMRLGEFLMSVPQ